MIRQKLNHNWQMYGPGESPRPAVVPGTVYTDLLRSGDMEDPFWKDNEISALALMEKDYTYEICFDGEKDLLASRRILLRFDGLDTIADIYLNEVHVGSAYNMHRIWEYDVTQILRERDNKLRVVLHSPLNYIREAFGKCRTLGSEDAMDGFVHIRKAHCMFGWDWGAHLPDAGIFRQVSLLGITDARLDSVYVRQEHTDGELPCILRWKQNRYPLRQSRVPLRIRWKLPRRRGKSEPVPVLRQKFISAIPGSGGPTDMAASPFTG